MEPNVWSSADKRSDCKETDVLDLYQARNIDLAELLDAWVALACMERSDLDGTPYLDHCGTRYMAFTELWNA